jgi:DNA invertase Pin-like site-specific DNA recombinase
MTEKITMDHLGRKAIVYVRQSTAAQVRVHVESTKLQYALAGKARDLGFTQVDVIDDDLGRSGSGVVERHGFNELLGAVCANEVGAVLCIEDARLARNGREWHHLIDLCALTGTLIIDPHGVFDPRLSNDRLLLGLKGSMAEFELSLFRQRSFDAIRAKARRGELRFRLPVGMAWNDANKIEVDADLRVREAIRLVFRKLVELGSARQVLKWFRGQIVVLPVAPLDQDGVVWKLPDAQAIHSFLTNPFYAGAYAFGRTEIRTTIIEGRARKTVGHRKPMDRWTVLIREYHEGYISWAEYERNQATLAGNAPLINHGKLGRGGRCLLIGLLRCRRCGRMLSVVYKGTTHCVPRYFCAAASRNHGVDHSISFGGLRADQAVGEELLRAMDGRAIDAAIVLAEQSTEQHEHRRRALALELEQLRYEARLAERRYQAVDPDNRLVASELEVRWNAALSRVSELERSVADLANAPAAPASRVDRASLLTLADDLSSGRIPTRSRSSGAWRVIGPTATSR